MSGNMTCLNCKKRKGTEKQYGLCRRCFTWHGIREKYKAKRTSGRTFRDPDAKPAPCWVCAGPVYHDEPGTSCPDCQKFLAVLRRVNIQRGSRRHYDGDCANFRHEQDARIEHYRQLVEQGRRLFEPTPGETEVA